MKKLENNPIFIGNWLYQGEGGRGFAGAVWNRYGIAATMTCMEGGSRQPMILEIEDDETKNKTSR